MTHNDIEFQSILVAGVAAGFPPTGGGGVGQGGSNDFIMDSDSNNSALMVQWIIAENGTPANKNLTYDPTDVQMYPLSQLVPTTICYAIIFVAGILGNVVTCIIINKNKSMHTATNYYLFNLAISDLLLLICGMPLDLYNMWIPLKYPFGTSLCMTIGMMSETTTNATVLTITSFTVERYIAICHPFRQHTMDLNRAVKFIFAIWIVSFCLAIPQFIQFGVIEEQGNVICTIKNKLIDHAFEVSSFVFFVGPMIVICALYILIGIKLHKSKLLHGVKRKGCSDPANRTSINNSSGQARVIRMLIAVVVAFFLCWAPFHAQRLMAVYGSSYDVDQLKIYGLLNQFSGILYFLSTCINPLLYNIMSHKFRDAFKTTIARQLYWGGRKSAERNHSYSAISRGGAAANGGLKGAIKQRSPPNRMPQAHHSQPCGVIKTSPIDNHLSLIEHSREYPADPLGASVSEDHRTREEVGRIVEPSYHENGDVNAIRPEICRAQCYAKSGHIPTSMNFTTIMDTVSITSPPPLPLTPPPPLAVKKKTNLFSWAHTTRTLFHFRVAKKDSAHSDGLTIRVTGSSAPAPRRLKKLNSVDSANTISNSSLQEVDEEEFNSSDLVKYMEQINLGIKS